MSDITISKENIVTTRDVFSELEDDLKELNKKFTTVVAQSSWRHPVHRAYKSVRRRRR